LYWKNPGDHNGRVAWWHAELMDYNFEISHISGKKNVRADTLSRHPDYDQGENDNKQLVVLPPKFFTKAFTHVGCHGWWGRVSRLGNRLCGDVLMIVCLSRYNSKGSEAEAKGKERSP
jgi:hypothetical protein